MILFGTLLHVAVLFSAIMCDEFTESYDEEIKYIPTNFHDKRATCKTRNILLFICIFISYCIIINSC